MTQTYVYPIITTVFVIAMFAPLTQQQAYAQICESAEQEELQRRYTGTITVLEGMFDRAEAESETIQERIQTSRDEPAAIRPLRDLSGGHQQHPCSRHRRKSDAPTIPRACGAIPFCILRGCHRKEGG